MRNSTIILIITIAFFVPSKLMAQTKLVFSYVEHPLAPIVQNYLSLAYKQLGYDLQFVAMTSQRAEKSARQGLVDGMMGRMFAIEPTDNEIVAIEAPISMVSIYLLCNKTVDCSEDVLADKQSTVLMSKWFHDVFPQHFISKISARPYIYDQYGKAATLLLKDRFDYAIHYVPKTNGEITFSEVNQVYLTSFPYYHILNKKHQKLAGEIAPVIDAYRSKMQRELVEETPKLTLAHR